MEEISSISELKWSQRCTFEFQVERSFVNVDKMKMTKRQYLKNWKFWMRLFGQAKKLGVKPQRPIQIWSVIKSQLRKIK